MPDVDLLGDVIAEPAETRGRPAHEPVDQTRETVQGLAGVGVPHEDIARILRIDPKTLREHYRDDLDRGKALANAKVGKRLFEIATGAGREAVTAATFWLKCQAGWSEYTPVQRPDRAPSLGKKDAAELAAETADAGTGWAGLLH